MQAYRRLDEAGLQHPVLQLNLAQLQLQQGDLPAALKHLEQTLAFQPEWAMAWSLQGIVQRRCGDLSAARASLERALALDSDHFPAWLSLSVLLHDVGEFIEARTACEQALRLDPRSAAAYANLSMIQLALADAVAAESSAREAILLDPALPEGYLNLGNALHAREDWQAAIEAHRQAIALRPGFAPALSSLGNALKAADQLLEAEQAFLAAIEADPGYFQAHSNLAITRRALGRLDQALAACETSLDLAPESADVHSNHGVILQEIGELSAAEEAFRRALSLSQDHAEAHFSLASVLLQQSRYEEGWKEYEWRFAYNERHPIVRTLEQRSRWKGPALQARVSELVLLHEQGLGDSFQFIRFAPLLRSYAEKVIFTCPRPLASLFSASGLVDEVVPIDMDADRLAPDAVWLPLMSIPGVLGLAEEAFAQTIPFFPVDPQRCLKWKQQLRQGSDGAERDVLIGLNWQGNPDHEKTTSRGRSIPLQAFEPLADLPGVRFLSLQKGYGSEQLETCSFRHRFVACQDVIDAAWDFEDAAALMACCQVVISSDTSAAHLAGAIGAPLWMPLKRIPEWRWGTEGTTTPWYPTARLFRQQHDGDWSGPVAAMRRALEEEILASRS
ncbi:MAG: tetratricopeptide repeat protein [Cyanobacteriota bacterium]|nr:tetratricopeptide repeat protein [Cyanobacteriota bacterium]